SHAAHRLTTHRPSGLVGGLPAATTRHRCDLSALRFHPMMNVYCVSEKSDTSSKKIRSCGLPLYFCLSSSSWHPPMSSTRPGKRHTLSCELNPSRCPRISA